MFYLADVALFGLLVVALAISGLCLAAPHRSLGENLLLPGAAFLGFWAFALQISGLLGHLNASIWFWAPWPFAALLSVQKRALLTRQFLLLFSKLRAFSPAEKALAAYLLLVFALTFALTLAPPSSNDYDSLTYHLAVPAHYLRENRVMELRYDHHSYFPFSLEMLYTLGLAVRGPVFAKLFHWLMLPLCCGVLLALGARHFSRLGGLLAAAFFASLPMVLTQSTTAYIDLGFTAFALLAVLCFLNGPQNRREWAWSGLFCGFCLGSKYLGALIFGFLGLWMLASGLKNRRFSWQNLALFGGAALLVGAPWYLRNILWVGNPVYPFAYGLFGGAGWTAEMAALYDADQAKYGFGKTPLDFLWLPWRLAMTPLGAETPFWPLPLPLVEEPHNGYFEVPGQALSSFAGPALLAFGLPVFFLRPKPRAVAFVLWFFGFLALFWAATSQQVRYLLPGLALFSVAVGWGLSREMAKSRVFAGVAGAFLALWLGFAPLWAARMLESSWPVVLGRETPENYLWRSFGPYPTMQWANQNTPRDARFAIFGETRCFYLDRHYFWADDAHNNLIDYSQIRDGAALTAALKKQGANYVLKTDGMGFGPPPQWSEAVESGAVALVFESRRTQIYRIE